MKTVLITGANRGIGLEHARRYAEAGAHVLATARDPAAASELAALRGRSSGAVDVFVYDAAAENAAAPLKQAIGDRPIDLLLANAGSMGKFMRFGDADVEAILDLVRVNALAPLQLAEAFADNVAASERKVMAFQSSLMGSVGDNGSGGFYDYRISKAALNMVAKGVANDLRARGVVSIALHPGWVRTRMGGPSATVSVEACVEGQQLLLERVRHSESGSFFNYDGRVLPW